MFSIINIDGETKDEENTEVEVEEKPKESENVLEDTTESLQTATAVEESEATPAVEESETTPAVEEEVEAKPSVVEEAEAKPSVVEEVEAKPPIVEDEAAMSDNEIEKQEVTDIIEKEVEKLEMEPLDNGLQIEELNCFFSKFKILPKVYFSYDFIIC